MAKRKKAAASPAPAPAPAPMDPQEIDSRVVTYAKALSHPVRVSILQHIKAGENTSPNRISKAVGESGPTLGTISYHVRKLVAYNVIEIERTEPCRGALEHFYRLAPDFDEYLKRTHSLLNTLS